MEFDMKGNCIFIIAWVIFFCSCGEECPQDLISLVNTVKTDGEQVRKYLDKDIYLNVNMQDISASLRSTNRSAGKTDELNKMKAALYRFYSHVKTVEGKQVCSLKNAREINISKKLFAVLRENLEEGNAWIEKCKKEGKEVIIQEVSGEYLNALLE